jgi:hypothetical protein
MGFNMSKGYYGADLLDYNISLCEIVQNIMGDIVHKKSSVHECKLAIEHNGKVFLQTCSTASAHRPHPMHSRHADGGVKS